MKIFVAMHKKMEINLKEGYIPLLVGSYNKTNITGIERDDTGDNISFKNKNYCELTGIYWIWKNVSEDVVGLCHYRRFFVKNIVLKNDISKKYIYKILKKYDVIVPKKFYYATKIKDDFKIAPSKEDMNIVRNCIKDEYSEYLDDFDKLMNSNTAYLYNMIITKKEIFDEYCEWLFRVLDSIEKRIDITNYNDYRARIYGFISERLLNIWLLHNNKLKIKEINVAKKDSNVLKRFYYVVKQFYRKKMVKIDV